MVCPKSSQRPYVSGIRRESPDRCGLQQFRGRHCLGYTMGEEERRETEGPAPEKRHRRNGLIGYLEESAPGLDGERGNHFSFVKVTYGVGSSHSSATRTGPINIPALWVSEVRP